MNVQEVYEFEAAGTSQKKIRPNYISAVVWTAITTFIVCVLFVAAVLIGLDYFGVYDKIAAQNTRAVRTLTVEVKKNAKEFEAMKEQTKEMRQQLNLWTPIGCRPKENWRIKGYGLPELERHMLQADPLTPPLSMPTP